MSTPAEWRARPSRLPTLGLHTVMNLYYYRWIVRIPIRTKKNLKKPEKKLWKNFGNGGGDSYHTLKVVASLVADHL